MGKEVGVAIQAGGRRGGGVSQDRRRSRESVLSGAAGRAQRDSRVFLQQRAARVCARAPSFFFPSDGTVFTHRPLLLLDFPEGGGGRDRSVRSAA